MGWIMAAIFFPALLVYVFSSITYNRFIGLALAVALISASAYAGYTDTWIIIILDALSVAFFIEFILDACSLTFGLWLSMKYIKFTPRQST